MILNKLIDIQTYPVYKKGIIPFDVLQGNIFPLHCIVVNCIHCVPAAKGIYKGFQTTLLHTNDINN